MTKVSRPAFALLVLFVLSGFAGLVYQSVWSHYLGLTLGHAAYAQTVVLAIFMGGMALGAWLASRYSTRWRRLILGYALVEGVIGVCGLLFHPVFAAYTGLSQDVVLPLLGSAPLAHAWQWATAALIIALQSILLGATFPLMSAGLIRALPDEHGEVLGGLYFSNSLGAAFGALLATFVLLPAVGLPGTVFTAGVLNILVAIGAWGLSKLIDRPADPVSIAAVHTAKQADAKDEPSQHLGRLSRVLLWSTAVSGAASFVYEVGWVRLLNQALGATIHSFELMLAAFILGLAFGGLWIRKRAKRILEPVRYVGYVQVWMAIAALLSVPVFTQSFRWVGWMMDALSRTAGGYTLFELGTALIALLVMFPAAFLAGMTLPLFTLALLRAGAGERAIGRIYAANTLGAIVGVALAMHVLIPLMGVRLAVTLAAIVDGLVGLYLLRVINPAHLSRPVATAAMAMAAAIVVGLALGRPDPLAQVSGVFRSGIAVRTDSKVEYLRDGKTATVAVFTAGPYRTIATNGKSDASLTAFDQAAGDDEITMVMAGALPLALHPRPERIAVIGWGSGLTTHTLLGSALPKAVDTIEIEQAMVEGARLYGDRVSRAYGDPRSHIRIDDARTFFSTGARRYDVIVSEPSNPWVSGVASLFTKEFYAFLKHHLNEGGIVVQWLHMYEIDDPLFATMMAALLEEFPQADLYLTNSADLLIVARTDAPSAPQRSLAPDGSALQAELRRVGLDRPEEIALRRIGSAEALRNFVRAVGAQAHSDYYPTVSLDAPRTRFMGSRARLMESVLAEGMPVLDILDCRNPVGRAANLPFVSASTLSQWQQTALAAVDSMATGVVDTRLMLYSPQTFQATQALIGNSRQLGRTPNLMPLWSDGVATLASRTLGHLPSQDLAIWTAPIWLPAEAAARPEVAAIMAVYSATARRVPSEMRKAAQDVLALPPEDLSPMLRGQMLSIAMLGALGTNDRLGTFTLQQAWGAEIPLTPERKYLLAWAQGGTPACVSKLAGRETAP